jgi:hypothetical protein
MCNEQITQTLIVIEITYLYVAKKEKSRRAINGVADACVTVTRLRK